MKTKTKIIIATVVLFVVVLLVALTLGLLKRSDELAIKENYFNQNKILTTIAELESLDTNKPVVVLFHAPECPGCLAFKPVFEQLAKDCAKDFNFVKLNIREPQNMPLVAGNVGSIPTITIFDTDIGNKVHISLGAIRTYNELKMELDRYKNIRSFIDIKRAKEAHQQKIELYQKSLKQAKR